MTATAPTLDQPLPVAPPAAPTGPVQTSHTGGGRVTGRGVEAALLPKMIGQGRARRLLLTGETIGAAEALAWGLLDVVAPPEALDKAVEDLARPILAAGPNAIRLQKSLILDWEELPTAAAVQRGVDCFVSAYDTDEPARMAGAMVAELRARRQLR